MDEVLPWPVQLSWLRAVPGTKKSEGSQSVFLTSMYLSPSLPPSLSLSLKSVIKWVRFSSIFLFPHVFIPPSTLLLIVFPCMFSYLFQVLFLLVFLPSPFLTFLCSFSLNLLSLPPLILLPFFPPLAAPNINFFLLPSDARDLELL